MKQEIIAEIAVLDETKRQQILQRHKESGVIIPCDSGVMIGENVKIEKGTLVLPGCILVGDSEIAQNCVIGPNTLLYNTKVSSSSSLNSVQAYDSTIGENADIGPFVHIRPNSHIQNGVHLGNFVEVKNSTIDDGTKVSHLTYVGDSDVGKNVNFGCGCVTVNYNGKEKNRTKIGNNAFIGCNTNLIAPVTVGDFAYTAAGSTVTDDVPENALAIARARQINKDGWVEKKKPYKNQK